MVSVQFWRAPPPGEADRRKREVFYGELEDISAGGMRVDVPRDTPLSAGQTCECLFVPRHGEPPIILDAVLRHTEDAQGERASWGFQFVGLETTAEGRETLARLARVVGNYQFARSRA